MSEHSLFLFIFFPRILRLDHRSVFLNVHAKIKPNPKHELDVITRRLTAYSLKETLLLPIVHTVS